MGELIEETDVWRHLPCLYPNYPDRLQQASNRLSPALQRWWTGVQPLIPATRQRLEQSQGRRLTAEHPLMQSAGRAVALGRLWFDGAVGGPPYLVVVGPRCPSDYAVGVTRRLVTAVAPYVTVVSGMAYGIDTVALETAAAAGGRCVAISPAGVQTPVPAGTVATVRAIVQSGQGAVVSEYLFVPQVGPRHFIHRNRILAAVATVLLVIEAAPRSGTMTTARLALNCGTTVATVPGDITRPNAAGSNGLIRDGAQVILGPADLAALLGIVWRERAVPPPYRSLVVALERGKSTVEQLAEALACDLPSLARLLLLAEQDSIVSRDNNGAIILQQG